MLDFSDALTGIEGYHAPFFFVLVFPLFFSSTKKDKRTV